MGKFRDGMPVTGEAVTLILSTIDRLKEVLTGLEQTEAEPDGNDKDLIGELERMAMAAAKDEPKPAKNAIGTLVTQTLERPLRPGEVSLDELERAFRETEMEMPAIVEKPKAEAPKAENKQSKAETQELRGRRQARDENRQPVDPRARGHAGKADDDGVRAGAHAKPAAGDRAA